MKYTLYHFIYLFCLLSQFVRCHSINNKQLLWVETITSVGLDIADRPKTFFEKRAISPNNYFQPNLRTLEYDDSLRLTLTAFNTTVYLHLIPNLDLFHSNAVIHQQGRSVKIKPSDYRVYRGYVIEDFYSEHWWLSGLPEEDIIGQPGVLGWARIVIRNDIKHDLDYPLFEGAFSINGDIHHIKLRNNYHLTKRSDDADLSTEGAQQHLVIYRDSDTVTKENKYYNRSIIPHLTGECGFDRLSQHHQQLQRQILDPFKIPSFSTTSFSKNSVVDSIFDIPTTPKVPSLAKRAPAGCPTTKKILYMGAAADCTYTKHYGTTDNARMQIINDWNSVSSVYSSTFNVAIGLINITIMDSSCPANPPSATNWNQACSNSYPITTRLSDFSRWRGSIGDDGAGLWHLMTNCATGAEVGIAWMSQVCNTEAIRSSSTGEYTSGTGVSSIIRDEWKVVAHEIGHGFGAIHDCNAMSCPCSGSSCQCCPYSDTQCDAGGKYFMNPTSNASSDAFSPCSINTICGSMSQFTSCLQTPGSRNVTTLQMCGNGIKETGEDCDTGGLPSNCCDPSTCKFKPDAVCDDFNDGCCNNCQLRPANYTCRPASTVCDIPEVCSGTSGDCPEDKFKDDLSSCGNGLQCASGQCTSRNTQCAARGVTYSITKACAADNGCQITCQDPRSALSCIQFPGAFIDGTPCGIGGICKAGSCNNENLGNNIKNWIQNNLKIVIPVAVVVGLLLLCCLYRCCCYGGRRTGYNDITKTTIYTIPGQQPPAYGAPPPPPQQYVNTQQPYYPPPPNSYYTPPGIRQNGWVDPAAYNGYGNTTNNRGPQSPLPVYSQHEPNNCNNSNNNNDSYEMNNAQQWRQHSPTPPVGTAITPNTPTPAYQMPQPSTNHLSAPGGIHNTTNIGGRPFNEGVV
ncbi:Metallo-peptidase family M12B Reprolysin-like-domain-containing protein [Mycotypha africana]|uniref:Metallo-peptidase family M12B Reprolysin-like-domain-containing protein n=1 Tax=Mycotypha africana TaxID=64632 RepID=UPI002301EBD1|nr:Metallo-peptidase family M12B Reprolysin-like-domain-containing protein [Mycotypha africana]KAI8982146.1 Metallo-peptidase family M12B Reprolysin-like-domain-containing protein [Mycotypha africana]